MWDDWTEFVCLDLLSKVGGPRHERKLEHSISDQEYFHCISVSLGLAVLNHSSNFAGCLGVPVTICYGDTTGNFPQESIAHTNPVILSSHIPDILNEPCFLCCGGFFLVLD